MTTEEKNKALKLKANGLTEREVSRKMGIAFSTIQNFFTKADLTDVYFVCFECVKEAVNIKTRGRPKKYCSRKCAIRHKSRNRPLSVLHKCKCCGKEYRQIRSKNCIFCSRKCYLDYRYGNKRISDPNS